MLRGAMSVTAALPAVPRAVARRARPACSRRWGGGGSSHRRHPPAVAEPAWTTGRLGARRRFLRVSSETAVGPRSFRKAARLASSRDDDPGCAASDPGAKPPVDETVDDATPRPRGSVNGVQWASARVLELDANVPGWWSFPHERDEDGRFTGSRRKRRRRRTCAFFAASVVPRRFMDRLRARRPAPTAILSSSPATLHRAHDGVHHAALPPPRAFAHKEHLAVHGDGG
jgi:hypothetical protein